MFSRSDSKEEKSKKMRYARNVIASFETHYPDKKPFWKGEPTKTLVKHKGEMETLGTKELQIESAMNVKESDLIKYYEEFMKNNKETKEERRNQYFGDLYKKDAYSSVI
jgi:hypothetical protein